ncbi:MAG: PAS domain S-box protein [Bacteroidales bacterium]|nr:PAS domain S-box protein [Bacteroidales bacterium]
MGYEFSTLCYIRFLSGVFALILVALLWRQRDAKGVIYLMLFELAAAIWAIGDGFENAALTIPQKIHWSQFSYTGISTCSVMFLMFAINYTDQTRYANLRTLLILLVIPLFTMIVAITNPLHGLLWANMELVEGTNQIVFYYGPYFWIQAFYQYSILILGIIILMIGSMKVYTPYKTQFWIVILGAIFPFCASIVYVFKLLPIKGFDPTPLSFILTGFIVALGVFWFRMFNIIPIARKQAVDNLRDGMIVVDSVNRIVDANAAFYRMTGLNPRQVIGNQVNVFFSDAKIDLRKFSEENDYTAETQLVVESDPQDIEVKYHRITDANNKDMGGIYMLTNITTKKMILDAIADSNKRRKTELIEKEKLILDLDAYARSVAHDLKNPIGSVVSLSELIKLKLAENNLAEVDEMVGYVYDQSKKMIRIIDGLLMRSRIRKEDIIQTPINTDEILHEVFQRLENEIIKRNAIVEKPDHWPAVMGHTQWIEAVWMNLLSNAIKYGGTPPVIKLGYEEASSSSFRFWIQDNGNGLPETSLKKIFRDFERLGVIDSDGYGLGLPIVKRISEKLGCEIMATSSNLPGEGCIFSFTLNAVS